MTFKEKGASLTVEPYGDRLIAGDLESDGSDPYAVLRLWRKAEAYADLLGREVIVTAETARMAEFFFKMGLEPVHVVFVRRNGKNPAVQGTRQRR